MDGSFSYLSDDNKVILLLYSDSRLDDNKNNFVLSASITYILETERCDVWMFECFFSLTLILLFISSDTFNFKLFCLVILFTIVFNFL